jgi:hypothetical protein
MSVNRVPAPEKTLTHIYVRDAQKAFVRACWRSGNDIYCGMCMRATIQPVIEEVCPICASTVERILEVAPGGVIKSARKHRDYPVRVGQQRGREAEAGALVEVFTSRKAGT